jgi:hypothetical protein
VSDTNNLKVFAFIVGEDVVGTLHIPEIAPNYERLVAGLSSNPIVVDATDVPGVEYGWKFDGILFSEPKE